jgi:copper chaperone
MSTITYDVPGVSCGHCDAAISAEVGALPGVETVEVDLERKLVVISGRELNDKAIRGAIYDAGYKVVNT